MSAYIDPENGVKKLLDKLDDVEVMTLARTVTQGLMKIPSVDDAVKAIIKHSPNILSILRRKILTKEILFSYLDENNVKIKLPCTKNDLIDIILQHWNIPLVNSAEAGTDDPLSVISQINKPADDKNGILQLAEQFCRWFYDMFNKEGVGSEHFFSDVKLTMNLLSDVDANDTVLENDPAQAAAMLNQVKLEHNLFFNPNLTNEGIQGRLDPHGLAMVMACGTLHIQETCAGVFEQVFALARDPFSENNWKIKTTTLQLRSKSGVISQPTLRDSELTSGLLMLPSV